MNWPREHPSARFCACAAVRAASRVIPLLKAISLVDQGTFPQQPAGSMFRLPISPMAQPPSIQVRAPGCVTAQPGELLAAIGVEIEVTLDVRRLQNRHNWIERCDRKRNIDANLPVTIQSEGFIRRATSDAKSRKISGPKETRADEKVCPCQEFRSSVSSAVATVIRFAGLSWLWPARWCRPG